MSGKYLSKILEEEGNWLKIHNISNFRDIPKTHILNEYDLLQSIFFHPGVTDHLLKDRKYKDKNRYSDIFVYGYNRVKLREIVGKKEQKEDNIDDYINASYVNSPFSNPGQPEAGDKKLIASQGPLASTLNDFW